MSETATPAPPRKRSPWLIGLAALCVGAVALYLIGSEPRKPPDTGTAQTWLKELVKGPMTAFVLKPHREPPPDILFQDESGKQESLKDWRGQVVLVNLWATWCAPCRKEMPTLDKLQQSLGSPDFQVVAISLDRDGAKTARPFLDETGAKTLKLYVDTTARSLDALRAVGLPATVLLDRQGNEVGRLLGPAEWDSPEAVALIKEVMAKG